MIYEDKELKPFVNEDEEATPEKEEDSGEEATPEKEADSGGESSE